MMMATRAEQYEDLMVCYHTGQISERQWTAHLKDPDFKAWIDQFAVAQADESTGPLTPCPSPGW